MNMSLYQHQLYSEAIPTSYGMYAFTSHEDSLTRSSLRLCLVLAGIACILRPTNLLIWASLVAMIVMRAGLRIFHNGVYNIVYSELLFFSREVVLCGAAVLGASAISDRLYFGIWTFPPYQWMNFNITQALAVFYGTNDWHYYLSQGLPLLLTTCLPFAVQALLSLTSRRPGPVELSGFSPDPPIFYRKGEADLIFVALTMITTLSLISHKEVRFIYPLLPCLHVLAAPYLLSFFAVHTPQSREQMDLSRLRIIPERVSIKRWRVPLFILLVITNIAIGLYTTQVHQRGVIDVLTFLRHEYEDVHISKRDLVQGDEQSGHAFDLDWQGNGSSEIFASFLMPCHSTPWRSHLVYPKLQAWALTCEPPLHIPANSPERGSYRDEADRFYDDPSLFLRTEMNTTERRWPRYLVGFEGIESILEDYCEAEMPGRRLRERWRGFNSHWHDDSRRKGTVVVWDFIDS
jgi:phosphatidylinositol glycan class B